MDEQQNNNPRPVNPRRKPRSKWELFKEAYLPVVIAGAAVLRILIFIIGSIVRAVERSNAERDASIAASMSEADEALRLETEADNLLSLAMLKAESIDYDGAIGIIDSFSGNIDDFPDLLNARTEYEQAKSSLVAWTNPDDVLSLSFQLLIADPNRAFSDNVYGSSYKNNFVTTTEFSSILLQLYNNGYILVSLDDVFTTSVSENGDPVYAAKTLYLPEGKKPLILTQTNVNYNNYMIDSDGDLKPDKGADGFASKLIIDANGKLTNEYVDAQGNTLTGAYDLVPILNSFIEAHPDFSYRGAKAILAVTGYDGLFGYRTYPSIADKFGKEHYDSQVSEAKKIIDALRNDGYQIACYTYNNEPYGSSGVSEIKSDIKKWNDEVTPILGQCDVLVLAKNSDIAQADTAYYGEKYEALKNSGFTFYLGFCENGKSWSTISTDHVRLGRLLVTGSNLANHADWFTSIWDTASVLDASR